MGAKQGKSERRSQSPNPDGDSRDQRFDFATTRTGTSEDLLRHLNCMKVDEILLKNPNMLPNGTSLTTSTLPQFGVVENGSEISRSRNTCQNSTLSTFDDEREISESADSERESSFGRSISVRSCQFNSGNTSFGTSFHLGSCATLEKLLLVKEKDKDITPLMEKKLRNYWFQTKQQLLEIVSSEVKISDCPKADIINDSGKIVDIDLTKEENRSVLLQGYLGSGKSTFVRQLGLDWAKNPTGTLFGKQFKLLFFLNQYNLTGLITEAMVEKAYTDFENPEIIWELIQRNQQHVFIIIDAFDMLNEAAAEDVMNLLEGKILPQSNVFVTSKPGKCEDIKLLFSQHYSMAPFRKEQIQQFFNVFKEDIKTKVYQMLPDCRDILQSPLFLNILSVIAKTNPEHRVYCNITNLYSDFIMSIMSQERISANFRDVFIEFGKICCQNESLSPFSNEIINGLKYKDEILRIELLVESQIITPGGRKSYYQARQRNFADYAMALYLSTLVNKSSFSNRLQRILTKPPVSELFLRFLIGLVPDKIDTIFDVLPRCLTQSWNLDLINIFGEAGVFSNDHSVNFATKMPSWIELKIKPAISSCERNGFCVLQPAAVVDTGLNPGFNPQLCLSSKVKRHLLNLFELNTCPITCIDLDLLNINDEKINGRCWSEFVFDLFTGISRLKKVNTVRVKCCKITTVICEIIAYLIQHIPNVEIQIEPVKNDNLRLVLLSTHLLDFMEKGHLKNAKIESLHISVTSSIPELDKSLVNDLCKVVSKCTNLSELKLRPLVSKKEIFKAILEMRLKKVTVSSTSKSKRGCKNGSHCSPFLKHVLEVASNSSVEYLDVSGLYAIDDDLDPAFSLISYPISQLRCLRMKDCFRKGMLPCVINLSVLMPKNRCWDLLDFSGWQIKMTKDNKEYGSVKTLVTLSSICENLLDIVDKFKVEKLVCDGEQLLPSKSNNYLLVESINSVDDFCDIGLDAVVGIENNLEVNESNQNYCCNLKKLRVKCSNSCDISTHISKFFNLCKLKLELNFKTVDLKIWNELKKLNNLKVFHLVFFEWYDIVMENIKKALELNIDKIKLTFDIAKLDRSYDFNSFNELFNCVYHELKNNNLKMVQISQKSYNYSEFLKSLEKWERINKANNLSIKLVKNNNKTCMTTIELSIICKDNLQTK